MDQNGISDESAELGLFEAHVTWRSNGATVRDVVEYISLFPDREVETVGGLSIRELLVLLSTIGAIVLILTLLRRVSRIERWLAKRAERRFLLPSNANPGVQHRRHLKRWHIPLPFALIIPLALLLVSFSDNYHVVSTAVDVAANAVTFGLIFAAVWNHVSPGSNRRLKYELLVAGTSTLSIGFFGLVANGVVIAIRPPSRGDPVYGQLSYVDTTVQSHIYLWVLLVYAVFLVAVQVVPSLQLPRRSTDTVMPSSHEIRLFRRLRSVGFAFAVLSFSGLFQPFLVVYLLYRYVLGERMSAAPILYLRSFHYTEGPTALGRIVAPVASRYGLLRALAHATQSPLQLHAETRLTERVELMQSVDSDWQDLIEAEMARASVIIIDGSVETQGLHWECERAAQLTNPSKVILLTRKDRPAPDLKLWNLEYELGRSGVKQAQKKLDEHLQSVLLKK